MKSFYFIAKLTSFITLFSAAIIGIVISLFFFSNFPQSYAKNWLHDYLQNTLSINAKFQSLSGNIYDSVTIDNIQLFDSNHPDAVDILSIESATLSFNLFKLLFYPNKLDAVNHLKLDGIDYYLIRDINGKWRYLKPSHSSHHSFLFSGNIFINNLSIHYHDSRGWKKRPLLLPFQTSVDSLSGSLAFNTPEKGIINLSGIFTSSQQPFQISGYIWPFKQDYLIRFNTPSLDIKTWAPYVIPLDGFSDMSGNASIDGYITKKKYATQSRLPFWYDISFDLTNNTLKTPYIDAMISSANGRLTISQGVFDNDFFRSLKPYISSRDAQTIESSFNKQGIIDTYSCLTEKALTLVQTHQISSKNYIQNHVKKTMLNPKFLLTFHDIAGDVSSIPVTLNGTLNINDSWTELSFDNHSADSTYLTHIFPMIEPLSLQHKLSFNVSVFGNLKNPIIKGNIESPYISCFNQTLHNVISNFKFYNHAFNFNLEKGLLYKSPFAGNVHLDMATPGVLLSSQFFLSDLSLPQLLPNTPVTGDVDISLNLNGTLPHISGYIDILSKDVSLFNQSLNSFTGLLSVNSESMSISSGNLYINNAMAPLSVGITMANDLLEITATSNDVLFLDPFTKFSTNTGFLNLNAHVTYPVNRSDMSMFIPDKGVVSIAIDQPYINNKPYDLLLSTINFSNKTVLVDHFTLSKDDALFQFSGTLDPDLSSSFDFSILDIDTRTIPYMDILVPNQLSPFSAKIKESTLTLNYTKLDGFFGDGTITLNDIDLNYVWLDALQSHVSFSDNTITFDSLTITKDSDSLYLKGTLNPYDHSFNFDILDSSRINLSLFHSLYNDPYNINGNILVTGNISYNHNAIHANGHIRAPRIDVHTIPVLNNVASFTFSEDKLHIHTLQSSINQGSVYLNGTISYAHDGAVEYRIDSELSDLPLEHIHHLSKVFKPIVSTELSDSQLSHYDLTLTSPFNNKDSILLNASYPSQSEYQFIQSLHSNPHSTNPPLSFLPKLLSGYISGSISFTKTSNRFPILDGDLVLTQFSTPSLSAERIAVEFNSNHNVTDFSCSLSHGLINQLSFNSSQINGAISDDYHLNIHNNYLKTSRFSINNLLVGSVYLPFLSESSHPIDMYLNLSNHNMGIAPIFSKSISSIDYQGELILNISGTLEKPFVNTLINSDHTLDIKLSSPRTISSYTITAPPFSISDNVLKFPNLFIQAHDLSGSSKSMMNSSFQGSISLESFDLTNLETLVSSVNISLLDQIFSVDNDFLNGSINMTNTSLTGTVITPLNGSDALPFYEQNNIPFPYFQSTIDLSNTEILIPNNKNRLSIPVFLDLNINLRDNVIFSGPIFGNNFFGISADLDFDQTDTPIILRGPLHDISISNQLPIAEGSLTILNKNFTILPPSKQQIYAEKGSILLNGINMTNLIDANGTNSIVPLLSLKALYLKETIITENASLQYTHILMTIDDDLNSIGNIYFDVFESDYETPNTISELTFIKTYTLSNTDTADSIQVVDSELSELMQMLIPEIYLSDSSTGLQSIGETHINTLIRRSILRPLEKNIAKQVGLNDLKINYNLGEKIISGTNDTLDLQFMKTLLSDRLVLNLSTELDLSESSDSAQSHSMELSEIKLSYYLLENKNLSLNYSNYKHDQLEHSNTYLSKFSMRYDYEY